MSLRFRYQPLPDVGKPLAERLGMYPRVPDLTLDALRGAGRALAVALVRLQFRVEVTGAFPAADRVALLANHQSHLDTLAVLAALPARRRGQLVVLAAKDYFFERWPRAIAASLFANAVAFDRTRYTELRRWAKILEEQRAGWLLTYPSGSRRRSEVHDALLVVLRHSGWTLVPLAISGTREAWPVGGLWRPFRRVRVVVGGSLGAVPTKRLADTLAEFWSEHVR